MRMSEMPDRPLVPSSLPTLALFQYHPPVWQDQDQAIHHVNVRFVSLKTLSNSSVSGIVCLGGVASGIDTFEPNSYRLREWNL